MSTLDWKVVDLGEVVVPGGIQTGPFGSQLHASDYSAEGIPVVMPRDMVGFRISTDSITKVPPELVTRLATHKLQEGDVVFSRRGEMGRCALVTQAEEGWLCGTGSLRVRLSRDKALPEFMIQFLGQPNPISWLETNAVGQTMLNLSSSVLSHLPILLPPLPEQRRIAQILRTWDEANATVEQFIAALQRRKKGLMQRLLTGQVRFPEFVVSQQTRATRYGAITVDWDYEPIGDIAMEISVKNRENGPLPVLSCTKYDGLVDSLEYFGRQIFSQDTSTYKVVKRGQFAYATNHIEEGSIGYQNLYDEALISPMYTVFQANERVDDAFLYRLLKTELYRHIFEVNTSGTVNRRGRLGWDDFARIKVPLPGLPEQRRIAEFFYVVDQEIELAKKQAEALKTQKKGLMQRLLTGQVRVYLEEPT